MAEWWQEFFGPDGYTLLEVYPPEVTRVQVEFVRRELRLQAGARVLDVACGIGRHSRELARDGSLQVVGIDYSQPYLTQAREDSAAFFARSDMRALPFVDESFDALLCLFNCLGYFDARGDDFRALQEMARVLKPNAPLLIDVLHRDGMARDFQAHGRIELPNGNIDEERTWDAREGRILCSWTFRRNGREVVRQSSNRMFTCGDMERLLNAAGLRVEQVWGGWGGTPLSRDDHALILLARKV